MIPAALALLTGGMLGIGVLWPFEMALVRAQEHRDQRRAEELAAKIRAEIARAQKGKQ